MPWESAAIGLLTDALKGLLGRLMGSYDERRAAQLVSDATRELLMEKPVLEKVRANLMEAESLLRTPSPELLQAQVLLDRVGGHYDSAHRSLSKLRHAYELQGNVHGLAEANYLSGLTNLESRRYVDAADSFRQAIIYLKKIGDIDSVIKISINVAKVFLNEEQIDTSREFLSEALKITFEVHDPRKQLEIFLKIGMAAASSQNNLVALNAYVAAHTIHKEDELWAAIQKLSANLSCDEVEIESLQRKIHAALNSNDLNTLLNILFDSEC